LGAAIGSDCLDCSNANTTLSQSLQAQALTAPQSQSVFDNGPTKDFTRPQEVDVFVDIVEANSLDGVPDLALLRQ
jgi:hypothetical protein